MAWVFGKSLVERRFSKFKHNGRHNGVRFKNGNQWLKATKCERTFI